jgi:very-short-patch-repair endonuclease/predicted DNA-binding protein YlxM (UPF0122 family)
MIDEKILKEIENLYGKYSLMELAIKYNVKYEKLYYLLKKRKNIKITTKLNGKSSRNKIYTKSIKKIQDTEKDKIVDLYLNKNLSLKKIAKLYNTTAATVMNFCKNNGIKLKLKNGKFQYNIPKFSKELLENLYINQKKSLQEIAILLNYNNATRVQYDFDYYNISRRSYSDAGINMIQTKPEILDNMKSTLKNAHKKRIIGYKTDIEKKFEQWCIDNNIKYEFQYIIENNPHNYDFYIKGTKILIELDGDYWHSFPESKHIDNWYDNKAKEIGYTVYRFLGSDIKKYGNSLFDERLKDEFKKYNIG